MVNQVGTIVSGVNPGNGTLPTFGIDGMRFVVTAITAVEVPANSTAISTFAVPGVGTNDVAVVARGGDNGAAGLGIVGVWCTANTVNVKFMNTTAGALTPQTGSYPLLIIRRGPAVTA